MAGQKQIAANRRNALKDTGPRTPRGKASSRLNALRYGLRSRGPLPDRYGDQLGGFENPSVIAGWGYAAWQQACGW